MKGFPNLSGSNVFFCCIVQLTVLRCNSSISPPDSYMHARCQEIYIPGVVSFPIVISSPFCSLLTSNPSMLTDQRRPGKP